jgi:ABC-type phosphate transport system substrate-binding protein
MTLLSFLFAMTLFLPAGDQTKIAVIVSQADSVKTLAAKEIKDIYTLESQKWPSGERIVVFNLKSKSVLKEKFYAFIGKTASELQRIWIRSELTGEAKAPTACKTEEELLDKVANTPNAIGYISASKVTAAVKVVATIE